MKIYLFCYKSNFSIEEVEKNSFIINGVMLDHRTLKTFMDIPIFEDVDLELCKQGVE